MTTVPKGVLELLTDSTDAGILQQHEQSFLEDLFGHIITLLQSNDYKDRLIEARDTFIRSTYRRSHLEDPSSSTFKTFLDQQQIHLPYEGKIADQFERLETAGIIHKAQIKDTIEPAPISLLPRIILRMGYLANEEVNQKTKLILKTSLEAWKSLGAVKEKLLKKAIQACEDLRYSLEPLGPMEKWRSPDLYDSGSVLYQNASQAIFIFSTTSGIIVPSEYNPVKFGLRGSTKAKARVRYFDEGVFNDQIKLKRFYQWDRYGTASRLFQNCLEKGKDETKAASISILAKALQMPNFEITEADFGKEDQALEFIKKRITLTCGRGVVFSSRNEHLKTIAHCTYTLSPSDPNYSHSIGYLLKTIQPDVVAEWDPEFLSGAAHKSSIPRIMLDHLYHKDVVRVIKRWDDPPMDKMTAYENAETVFNNLYEEGRRIYDYSDKPMTRMEFVNQVQ